MARCYEKLPDHVKELFEAEGEYKPLVRSLNCACVAAVFHNKQLPMGDDADKNIEVAENFLFDPDEFDESKGALSPGSVNVYFSPRHIYRWRENAKLAIHISVNLGNSQVLRKNKVGETKVEIISYDQDWQTYDRFGDGVKSVVLVRRPDKQS